MRLHSLLAILLLALPSHAAIYGADDRQDVIRVPRAAPLAPSVAVAIGKILMSSHPDGSSQVDPAMVDHLGDFVCSDERFFEQPSIGVCTGFLIGDRYLVTAGHCLLPTGTITDEFHPFCEAFDWVFDYKVSAQGKTFEQNIPADKRYGCKRVLRAENIEHVTTDPRSAHGNDFALIELDRPVVGARPLTIAKEEVKPGDEVFTIGHPTGLPAKDSGLARVLRNSQPHFFEVNLDTEGGNSGGPVFNSRSEVVGILVSGHPVDYHQDPRNHCDRPNRCDENGLNCTEDSVFHDLQTWNNVQKIQTLLSYLPKSKELVALKPTGSPDSDPVPISHPEESPR